jgi:hypothetical protein
MIREISNSLSYIMTVLTGFFYWDTVDRGYSSSGQYTTVLRVLCDEDVELYLDWTTAASCKKFLASTRCFDVFDQLMPSLKTALAVISYEEDRLGGVRVRFASKAAAQEFLDELYSRFFWPQSDDVLASGDSAYLDYRQDIRTWKRADLSE